MTNAEHVQRIIEKVRYHHATFNYDEERHRACEKDISAILDEVRKEARLAALEEAANVEDAAIEVREMAKREAKG